MTYRVLVTSKSFAKYNPEVIEELRGKGIEIVRAPKSNMCSREIAEEVADYDGIVCGIDPITREVIDAGKKLKVIHMNGTGVDHIDIQEATRKNVCVGNCPGANAVAVAELNLAILLAEARKIIKYSNRIREGKWEREVGVELSGKTMGILGLGAIGKKFAELLEGFRMKILAYDVKPDYEWCEKRNVTMVENVSKIFEQSDFISLNLPLLDSTKHIIDEKAFAKMKRDVIIVNTARGSLIRTEDLIRALKEGRIRGAALDAFETEPLSMDSELRSLDVTLTPHLGAYSIETMKNVSRIVADHLEEVLLHQDFRNMLNGCFLKSTVVS